MYLGFFYVLKVAPVRSGTPASYAVCQASSLLSLSIKRLTLCVRPIRPAASSTGDCLIEVMHSPGALVRFEEKISERNSGYAGE